MRIATMFLLKKGLCGALYELGYSVTTRNNGSDITAHIEIPFRRIQHHTSRDDASERIRFRIVAGTARKFDVHINDSSSLVMRRFDRSDAGIQKALTWIAGATESHAYMKKIMDSSVRPTPYQFKDIAKNGSCHAQQSGSELLARHGVFEEVRIMGMVTIDDTIVTPIDHDPDSDAWFLVKIRWHGFNDTHLIINGPLWHPVRRNTKAPLLPPGLNITTYTITECDDDGQLPITTADAVLLENAITQYANWLAEPKHE